MLQFSRRIQACTPSLRFLLLSELLGLLAAAAAQTSVLWWISKSGGAVDLTLYGSAIALGSLVAMPLMSPLGDRWPKRGLIRLGKTCLLLEALVLCLLSLSGVYHLALICACSLLSVLANAIVLPAQASILPELVETESLPEAIRLRRGAQALGGLLGPGLGGAALALGGVTWALALVTLLFGIAVLAAFRLDQPRFQVTARTGSSWCQDIMAGLRAKWGVPLDRWWTLTGALMMVFYLPATGMLLPLRLQSLQLSALWFGACSAALSLGLLLGVAGLADRLIHRLDRVRAIFGAIAVCGLALAAIGLCDWAPGLVLLFALMGLCISVTQLVGQTHRILAMPENFRSRMSAVHLAVAHIAGALAPTLAGVLMQYGAVASVYLLMAAGFLTSGLLLLAVPELRPFLRLEYEQVKNWYGRHYPQAFAARR
ncbi:MFS transporter [Paucibacter sp. Y2R2-4]|uniref:MFS transporter n=1 Tax=Paucibacter sp. Y2R2-4 TaxID=2893553 RepID=UPI0021E3D4EC|nr:MFS transporter [Paucibacter sp. Y2R2-4]MCV2352030.1 MFS transporter [Paucibacter sp. Y2R2-4]